jgi:hypothetical protein
VKKPFSIREDIDVASNRGADAQIIAGIVEGLTRAETAERAGISERTLRRRLKDPSVLHAIAEARVQIHEQVMGRLQHLAFKAVDQFDSVMDAGRDAARISASRAVLDQIVSFQGAVDNARLSAMEAAHAEMLARVEEGQ